MTHKIRAGSDLQCGFVDSQKWGSHCHLDHPASYASGIQAYAVD